ncbi:hypothetical protein FKM82_031081 [Ascaphus truei]
MFIYRGCRGGLYAKGALSGLKVVCKYTCQYLIGSCWVFSLYGLVVAVYGPVIAGFLDTSAFEGNSSVPSSLLEGRGSCGSHFE